MGKVSRVIEGRYYDIVIEKKKKNKSNLHFPTGQLMLLFSFRLLLCSIIILVVSAARATKSSSQSTTNTSNLYVRAESVNTVNPASRIINNNINSYNDNKRKTKPSSSSSQSKTKTPPYATNSSSSSSNTKRNNTGNNHLQFQTVKKFSGSNPSRKPTTY